jgi:hypothetical protein
MKHLAAIALLASACHTVDYSANSTLRSCPANSCAPDETCVQNFCVAADDAGHEPGGEIPPEDAGSTPRPMDAGTPPADAAPPHTDVGGASAPDLGVGDAGAGSPDLGVSDTGSSPGDAGANACWALELGGDGWVYIGDSIDEETQNRYSITRDFTVAIWVWITPGMAENMVLWDIEASWDDRPDRNTGIRLSIESNNKVRGFVGDGTGNGLNVYSTDAMTTGRWTHIALVRNGTTAQLWIDGADDNSANFGSNSINWSGADREHDIYQIGRGYTNADPGSYGHFKGKLYGAAVWNRPLPDRVMRTLHQTVISQQNGGDGLQANYLLNGDAEDSSENYRSASLGGTTGWVLDGTRPFCGDE